MFPIKQPIIKNVNKSEGTKLNVNTPVTDRITDTKETNYTRQIPMTKGGKKLNVSVVREAPTIPGFLWCKGLIAL